jgi:hypothetical protein
LRRGITWVALGALAPMIQGALARFLPEGLCPDLGLLLVLAVGLRGRSLAGGLLLSAFVGVVSDLLSGALLGQFVLLRLLTFAAARSASLHVNLAGASSKVFFVAVLTLVDNFAMGGLSAFFAPGARFIWIGFNPLALQVVVNSLAAPPVTRLVAAILGRLGGDDSARRPLRLTLRGLAS